MARSPEMHQRTKRYVQFERKVNQQHKAVDMTTSTLGIINPEIIDFIRECSHEFINRFARASQMLERPESIIEFEDACKKRFLTLQELVNSSRNSLNEGLRISVERRLQNGQVRTYKGKFENRMVLIDYDDPDEGIYVVSVNPKCYAPLFKGAYTLVYQIGTQPLDSPDHYDLEKALIFLLSMGKLYENLRGNLRFILQKERESFQRMTQVIKDDPWLNNSIQEVLEEIMYTVADGGRPRRYIADIVSAINNISLPEYSDDDYSYSFRSSGTKDLKTGRTVPALYASLVEPGEGDVPEIGFISPYSKVVAPGYSHAGNHVISIPQSKLAPRIIHITGNRNQDVGNYFHRRLERILRQMRSDCTFNQSEGVFFIQKVTSTAWREKHGNNVYCTDISDATGTVNQRFQRGVLVAIFGQARADVYMSLVTQSRTMKFSDGTSKKFVQTMGQPQGYKGSFPLFALGHHIVMRACMLIHGLENMNPADLYRVLGDDIVISVPDLNRKFLATYIELCRSINWSVHPTKGYRYFADDPDSQPIAEFAKVTVLDGRVFTPIPINLILNNSGSYVSCIQVLTWISDMIQPIAVEYITRYLPDKGDPNINTTFQWYLTAIRSLKVSRALESFTESETNLSEEDKIYILYSYLREELNTLLLQEFLPDHMRQDTNEPPEYLGAVSDNIYQSMKDDVVNSNSKFYLAAIKNDELLEAIKSVLPEETEFLSDAILSMGLTQDDIRILFQITEILSVDPGTWLGQSEILTNCILSVQSFSNRLSLRSIVKRRKSDTLLLMRSYQNYLEMRSGAVDPIG